MLKKDIRSVIPVLLCIWSCHS